MKRIKLFYAILITMSLIVASLLWFNAHWKIGYASQLDQIKARGVLRVATLNAAPSYFIVSGDKLAALIMNSPRFLLTT